MYNMSTSRRHSQWTQCHNEVQKVIFPVKDRRFKLQLRETEDVAFLLAFKAQVWHKWCSSASKSHWYNSSRNTTATETNAEKKNTTRRNIVVFRARQFSVFHHCYSNVGVPRIHFSIFFSERFNLENSNRKNETKAENNRKKIIISK